MKTEWQASIVALSLGISFIGSYTGITLYEQYRLITKDNQAKFLSQRLALVLMSVCFGGVTIWTMHFVGMSAIHILDPNGNEIKVRYDPTMTLMSLVCVLICVYAGLNVASSSKIFIEDEADTVAHFIRDMRTMTITQIRAMPNKNVVLVRALFRDMPSILISGLCLASGVCVMHYMGMMAMVCEASIKWDVGVIVASVIIALVASCAAFWILFRLLSMFSQFEILRVACAVIMSIAVNGMHYTGMAAASFVPHHNDSSPKNTIDSSIAVLGAIVAAVIVVMFSLVISVADVRIWYYNLDRKVRTLDEMFESAKLSQTQSARVNFINDYEQIKELDGSVGAIAKYKMKAKSNISSGSSEQSRSFVTPVSINHPIDGHIVRRDSNTHANHPTVETIMELTSCKPEADIESNVWAKHRDSASEEK